MSGGSMTHTFLAMTIEFQSNFNSPEGKSRLIFQFYFVIATSLRTMGDLKAMCQRGDRTTGNVANSSEMLARLTDQQCRINNILSII